jgi:hypothetical protein
VTIGQRSAMPMGMGMAALDAIDAHLLRASWRSNGNLYLAAV